MTYCETAANTPLRVAIIGLGRSGRDIHGYCLSRASELFSIAAVADPLADRLARARKEYGCETFAGYDDLVAAAPDLDLIVNATPSHLHVPVTLDLLKRGFNVLCEKPLARSASEVDALVEAADHSGKILAVFQQSRFAPCFAKVREVIESGALGRIVQISISYSGFGRRWDWQTLQEYNGGSLLNTGPHPLDQALELFGGDDLPDVWCAMDRCNTFGDAEDYVKLLLRGEGRPVVDLEISSCSAYPSFTYNVQGARGGLNGSTSHIEWKSFDPAEAPVQDLTRAPLAGEDGKPVYCSEQLTWLEGSWDDATEGESMFNRMVRAFYEMLHRTLTAGAPLEVTLPQVRRQIAVIEECRRQNPRIYGKA